MSPKNKKPEQGTGKPGEVAKARDAAKRRIFTGPDPLRPFSHRGPSDVYPVGNLQADNKRGNIRMMLDQEKGLGDSDKDAIMKRVIARENEVGKDEKKLDDIVREEVQKHLAEKEKK